MSSPPTADIINTTVGHTPYDMPPTWLTLGLTHSGIAPHTRFSKLAPGRRRHAASYREVAVSRATSKVRFRAHSARFGRQYCTRPPLAFFICAIVTHRSAASAARRLRHCTAHAYIARPPLPYKSAHAHCNVTLHYDTMHCTDANKFEILSCTSFPDRLSQRRCVRTSQSCWPHFRI